MKVLIYGLGSIAEKHISALRSLRGSVDICAIRSGRGWSSMEGVTDIWSIDELPWKPDFAIISNISILHKATIEELLPLRIPLFIEKPLFSSLEGVEELIDRCREMGVLTYVACNMRFHPCIRFLKEYIRERKPIINEVNIYSGSYLPDWRPRRDFRETYSTDPSMGGGVHLDLIHELDYTYWLFGNPIKVDRVLRNVSSLDIAAVDFAHYRLWYERFAVNITLNYFRRDAKREIEVVTDTNTLVANLIDPAITAGGDQLFSSEAPPLFTYIEQMTYFIHHIEGRARMMNDVDEAFNVLKICLL